MTHDEANEPVEYDAADLKLRFADDAKPRKMAGAVDRRFRKDFDLLAITVERSGRSVVVARAGWHIFGLEAVADLLAHELTPVEGT